MFPEAILKICEKKRVKTCFEYTSPNADIYKMEFSKTFSIKMMETSLPPCDENMYVV